MTNDLSLDKFYDKNILDYFIFKNNNVILKDDLEKIILEYFYKELIIPETKKLLEKKKNSLLIELSQNPNQDIKKTKEIEKELKDYEIKIQKFLNKNVQNIYYKFVEKFLLKNILKLTNIYEEYRIFEGYNEIISLLLFDIEDVDRYGDLSNEDKKQIKKIMKQVVRFLNKEFIF